jgi:hypothetical protein
MSRIVLLACYPKAGNAWMQVCISPAKIAPVDGALLPQRPRRRMVQALECREGGAHHQDHGDIRGASTISTATSRY